MSRDRTTTYFGAKIFLMHDDSSKNSFFSVGVQRVQFFKIGVAAPHLFKKRKWYEHTTPFFGVIFFITRKCTLLLLFYNLIGEGGGAKKNL